MTVQDQTTTATPEAATLTAKELFHDMLSAYSHFEGSGDTTRRLYDAAYHVLGVRESMDAYASSDASYDLEMVLGGADFQVWRNEGCTYASAARLVRARLIKALNGKVA